MESEKEMTAVITSVGADDGQSLNSNSNNSITDFDEKIKTFTKVSMNISGKCVGCSIRPILKPLP